MSEATVAGSLRLTVQILVAVALLLDAGVRAQPPATFDREQAVRELFASLGRTDTEQRRRMELSNQPGCYVFLPSLEEGDLDIVESVTWEGNCVDGLAEGTGELTFWMADRDAEPDPQFFRSSEGILGMENHLSLWTAEEVEELGIGHLVNGVMEGYWTTQCHNMVFHFERGDGKLLTASLCSCDCYHE